MTRTATEILLDWASNVSPTLQADFAEWFEKELEYYSTPKHGGVTGRIMEHLLDKFEHDNKLNYPPYTVPSKQ